MKYVYPKTIFVDENGEIIENNYDKTQYFQKKQWYEREIKQDNKTKEPRCINQRIVILGEIKARQLKIEFK